MIREPARKLALSIAAIVSVASGRATAQEDVYPMDAGLTAIAADAAVPRPGYLEPTVEPTFKTRVTRITDEADAATPRAPYPDGGPYVLRHSYSRRQPWNSDGSLLMISAMYLLDGKTYQRVGTYSEYSGDSFWSHTEPNVMFAFQVPAPARVENGVNIPAVNGAMRRVTYTKTGNTWVQSTGTPIAEFIYGQPFEEMYAGQGEGRPSEDDRYIAIVGRRHSESAPSGPANELEVLVLDMSTGQVVGRKNFGAIWAPGTQAPLDWCGMSPSGEHVLLGWKAWGDGAQKGVELYPRTLGNSSAPQQLVKKTEHGDVCWQYDPQNQKLHEVWAQLVTGDYEATYNADVAAWRLDNPTAPPLRMLPRPSPIDFGGHLSCTNYNRPGYAYITPDSEAQFTGAPSHIFAMRIQDNSAAGTPIQVEPFAHHRSNSYLTTTLDGYNYNSQPHGAPDPSGLRVMFASNWHASSTPTNIYSYVAERPNQIKLIPATPPAPKAVVAWTGKSELRFNESAWQAMVLKTPNGTQLPVTDPLLYQTSAANTSELPSAYWMSAGQTVSFSQVLPPQGQGLTAVIRAQRSGVTKISYVTVYPDDPLYYVVTRLTSDHAITSAYDNQLTYVNNDTNGGMYAQEVWLDGVQRGAQQATGSSWLFAYLGLKNASLAFIMAPTNQQTLKQSHRSSISTSRAPAATWRSVASLRSHSRPTR